MVSFRSPKDRSIVVLLPESTDSATTAQVLEAVENARSEPQRFFSINRVAELWDVKPSTLESWCRTGRLPARKFAGCGWRISADDLRGFVASTQSNQADEDSRCSTPPATESTEDDSNASQTSR